MAKSNDRLGVLLKRIIDSIEVTEEIVGKQSYSREKIFKISKTLESLDRKVFKLKLSIADKFSSDERAIALNIFETKEKL